jgi:hypothetical protein
LIPKIENEFREPTVVEQSLLARLLEANFPGRNELAVLLGNVLVKTIAMRTEVWHSKPRSREKPPS